jgi:hypothetical protein
MVAVRFFQLAPVLVHFAVSSAPPPAPPSVAAGVQLHCTGVGTEVIRRVQWQWHAHRAPQQAATNVTTHHRASSLALDGLHFAFVQQHRRPGLGVVAVWVVVAA